ncbi:MAG TPA: VWA domain-containing protein, partial [Polyangiaceae bacterium]|nr:VWA domain-containing protein [Polyangiaceae bacterium]
SDDAFLARLPALRAGFRVLGDRDRDRLLLLLEEAGVATADVDRHDPLEHAAHVELDREAMAAVQRKMGPSFDPAADPACGRGDTNARADRPEPRRWATPPGARLSVEDRVQLVLGRGAPRSVFGRAVAAAFEDPPLTAGREGVALNTREWAEALDRLVGSEIRHEVIAERARERPDLLALLDPRAVRPSADLLAQILDLRGSLGEGAMAKLRPLIRRVVDALTEALATEVQPALRGTRAAGWSQRDNGRLHLKRTVERNLRTAYRDAEGTVRLAPTRIAFEALARRAPPWEVSVLLDVSGSMEPSVVHTAVMAAVLAGVPWLDLRLFAFSTEVIEMTDVVHDPLELLLSVQIGGGTLIGEALAHVAATLRRPPRSLVLCVSDFADGGPPSVLLGAVRALRSSGVQLLGLASLDGKGGARYDVATAERLVAAGMPIAALSPDQVARWIKEKVQL